MKKTIDIETLVTATVTSVICDDSTIHITARSLMGKNCNYLIVVSGDRLLVTAYKEVSTNE